MGKLKEILMAVDSGVAISIDIRKRKIKLGKRNINADNIPREDIKIGLLTTDEVISKAEKLYEVYKYSIPNANSNKMHCNFKAVGLEELTEKQMLEGEDRAFAQAKLELWILFNTVIGNLKWEELNTNWYWYSKVDNDFIILKDMIVIK